MVVCVMANEQQNVLKEKKTVTISIEEYETFKAENARLNQQIQWLLEAYVFLRGSASVNRMFAVLILVRRQKPAVAIVR